MWLLFLLTESQSPPPSSSLPTAEGFAGPENFGDGQISPLDEVPCTPAAIAEETNYAAAPAAPLVASHGTGAGQFSSNFSLSSTTSGEFDEEEVQQTMMSLQPFLHLPMAPDGLSNTTNGGPAARSHADAVPVVQQGTSTTADELPHPQQQLPLLTSDPEAQPGGSWAWPDLSLANKEVQIQQMTPTITPSQPPSPTPVINPGPDEANHAASTPMGSQGTKVSKASKSIIPAAPQDQEANILSRASTRRKAKSRDLPSQLQDVYDMGMDMIRQFGRHIGKMMKEEKQRSIVWQHFRWLQCKYCCTLHVLCQYCNTVMRYPSTIEMLRHLESRHNNIQLLPASSRASKETQRSSQALQIKEIAENPNGESEPIEIDNSNCATAARVDTPGTNTVVLSPQQQHQLLMDLEEQIAAILSSQLCCQALRDQRPRSSGMVKYYTTSLVEADPWWDLIIRLSESSCCSSTARRTHDGFRLKFSDITRAGHQMVLMNSYWLIGKNPTERIVLLKTDSDTVGSSDLLVGRKVFDCESARAWVLSENKDDAGVLLRTRSDTIGSSYLSVGVTQYDWKSAPAGCAYSWQCMHLVFRSLGFRKEFARDLVIYALGWVNGCNLRLRSPRSSNMGKSIVEQGDVPSGKRKRKPLPPRSKVWNHFTKEEVVEAEGSTVTLARCNHCGSKLRADSASHGTTQLKRHITSKHPDKLAKSAL